MKPYFLSILFICTTFFSFAQSDKSQALAAQYYRSGDFEKAAHYYEELFKKDNQNNFYFTSLYNSYLKLSKFNEAEKLVKRQIKRDKDELSYYIDLAYVYSQNNNSEEAEEVYKYVINNIRPYSTLIRNIANKFLSVNQIDYAIKTFVKGQEVVGDGIAYSYDVGNLYLKSNRYKEAAATYLNLLKHRSDYYNLVENVLSSNINNKELLEELETQLYASIQKQPNNPEYSNLLIWLFVQQNDYDQALIQAIALDKRKQENGSRILDLAISAMQHNQFDAAINAYKYIQSKGEKDANFQMAKSLQIKATNLKVTTTSDYTSEDLELLVVNYTDYLNAFGKTVHSSNSIRELANLQAYYLHSLPEAIQLLEDLIALPNLPRKVKNEVKLDLGDYYVLSNDVWEATLIYAQVDIDEREGPLGEEARFRNAKLSYYNGDFDWAQAQLNVLKGATSHFISNDALELSVFILDNLGLDTTAVPMQMFADADLLYKQNKNTEALKLLDEILKKYPDHALTDDIYFKKANIVFKERKYEKAVQFLNNILITHANDILADNAAFMLGDIYENYLNNSEKAMEYYKLIITDYSDSILLVEARKRFRLLRGDDV